MINNAEVNLTYYLSQLDLLFTSVEFASHFDLSHEATANQIRLDATLQSIAYSARRARECMEELYKESKLKAPVF